jgi:hypothetical protein
MANFGRTDNNERALVEATGLTKASSASFARPADTTAYAALDAISDSLSTPTVLTFPGMGRIAGGSGYIVKARLLTDQKTNTARFRLHLFHTAPTPVDDNAPQTLLWTNRDKRVGYIDFDACFTEDPTNSTAAESLNTAVRLPFVCANGSQALYGLLEARDAFTPASGQQFYIELTVEQN